MLKKEELYTDKSNTREANSTYLDKNQVKLILIFTLLFMILTLGYLIYHSSKEVDNSIGGTRVLGVSYITDDKSEKEELNKKHIVEYNTKTNISETDDVEEYEDIVMVDDKDEYRDTTLVDDKNSI